MIDYPQYRILKYFYSDRTISDSFIDSRERFVVGYTLITQDGYLYFNQSNGDVCNINTEQLKEQDVLLEKEWANPKQISEILRTQPYDLGSNEWSSGYGMYSKELWRLVLKEFRNHKMEILLDKFDYKHQ